jgi:hypothetical protein
VQAQLARNDGYMAYAALAISVMALLFTVLSFWWLNARPGKLRAYEPTTWAAYVRRDRSAIRLPLVLHNTGATAAVITGMRLRFAENGQTMPWEWTRTTVNPTSDDVKDATAPFSIAGGGTHELVAEFPGTLPGVVPEQRGYPVAVELQSSRNQAWQPALRFTLQLGNLIHPGNYIVYSNDPDYLDDAQLAEGAAERAKLRKQWGLAPVDR